MASFVFEDVSYGNCRIDLPDLILLADQWLSTNPTASLPYHSPDILIDGNVNLHDFAMLSEQWLTCNDPQESGCIQNW